MYAVEIERQARMLMDSHGPKSIAEAAQKARSLEDQGDKEQAQTWRRIEAALMEMRGPRAK
jgi:hypothetical protein